MLRKICILHQNDEGSHDVAFMWETRKVGSTHDVISYLMMKFQQPEQFPAGYKGRPITTGDRITISPDEGQAKSAVFTYELATHSSYRRL